MTVTIAQQFELAQLRFTLEKANPNQLESHVMEAIELRKKIMSQFNEALLQTVDKEGTETVLLKELMVATDILADLTESPTNLVDYIIQLHKQCFGIQNQTKLIVSLLLDVVFYKDMVKRLGS